MFRTADEILREVRAMPEYITENYFYWLCYLNLFNLALSCEKLLDYKAAEENYKRAIRVQYDLSSRNDMELIETMLRLADLYLNRHQTDKAIMVMHAVNSVAEKIKQWPAAVYYNYIFYWCAILYQKDRQKEMLQLIHSSYQWMEENPAPAAIRYKLLLTEYDGWIELGKLDECLKVTDKIRELVKAEPDRFSGCMKKLYQMRAEILDGQGKREEAIQSFKQALQEYEKEKKPDIFWEISYWTSLSLTYIYAYRYNEAKQVLNRTIELAEKVSGGREEYNYVFIPIYLNMGLIYMRTMEYDKAEYYLFAALNLCKHRDDGDSILRDELKIIINLAWLYLSMWQYEQAVYYAHMAMQWIKGTPHIGKCENGVELCQILSIAYARQGKTEEGLYWIDEAIALKKDVASVSLCRCFCFKAIILRQIDRIASLEFHQKALNMIFELKLENTDLFLSLLANKMGSEEYLRTEDVEALKAAVENSNLPDSYYKLNAFADIVRGSLAVNNYADAFLYSAEALEIYKKIVTEALQYGSVENLVNYKKDIRLFYEVIFLGLLDKIQDLSGIPKDSPLLSWIQNYKIGDYYLLRQIRHSFGEDDSVRYRFALELRYLNFMAEFLHKEPEPENKHKLLLEKSETEYWSHRKKGNGGTVEDVEEERYEGFWCMDYYCPEYKKFKVHTPGFVIVWQYTDPKNKRIIKIGDVELVKESILQLRDAVVRDISTQTQEQKLYRLLLEPVMKELPHLREVQQFIICPDGMLALVPFEILLGTESRILYIPFMDLLCEKKIQDAGRAVVGGSPVITKKNPFGLLPLQYSEEECDRTADALRSAGYAVEILSGNGENGSIPFSRAEFLRCIEKEPVSIIHVSSHGFYKEKENMPSFAENLEETDHPYRRCGIIMNDFVEESRYCFTKSILSGEDILRMDLKNTQLVVLSTCVSGLGRAASGEWLTGLQRAFLTAGAENIIVSLWEVEEESTTVLMNYFYEHVKEDMPFDMALWQAKKDLIRYQGGIYSTPFYWAGFIYIGRIEKIKNID